jgi:UDP-N-acetylglucosamine 1-carboxyvinyltransferase
LGATVRQEHGYIEAEAPHGLEGAEVHFDRITVTGTEDLMMAAVLARGETVIHNAAREPEVVDLAALLTKMGASIEGAGSSVIRIKGVAKLRGARHAIIADRIETGTFLIAGAITRGDLHVTCCEPDHLRAFIAKLRSAGVEVSEPVPGTLRVRCGPKLRSVDVTTEEHPGFATDLQAQFMALMTRAEGISIITETIFENRFMHVQELARLGAKISLSGQTAKIDGVPRLRGAQVMATDLRASVSLVIAGLAAEGETVVSRVYHLDRGFERLEEKLTRCGANVERISE